MLVVLMNRLGIIRSVCILTVLTLLSITSHANVIGNISGDLRVEQGSLGYTLGLPVPAGVHGQAPQISVNYSAQAPNSVLGPSFQLDASSAITRCTPTVDQDGFAAGIQLDELSRFCHDGNKLVLVSGVSGRDGSEYLGFHDKNIQYIANGGNDHTPDSWTVKLPDGYTLEFVRQGSESNRLATWLLSSKTDIFGNTLSYSYLNSDIPHISTISYSGYQIVFNYQERAYPFSYYQGGDKITNDQLLNSLRVSAPSGALLYFYDFTYELLTGTTEVERLQSVTRCYSGSTSEGNPHCLKPVEFHYQALPSPNQTIDRLESDLTIVVPDEAYRTSGQPVSIESLPNYAAADITGNGLSDFCYYQVGAGVMCAEEREGTYLSPMAWSNDLGYTEAEFETYGLFQLIDLDLDGKADYCLVDQQGVRCGLSTGTGFSQPTYWNSSINRSLHGIGFAYINTDSYIDLCGVNSSGYFQCFAGNGSGFTAPMSNLSGIKVSHKVEWAHQICIGNNCNNTDRSYTLDMLPPQTVDIDGDFDKDLCWISYEQKAYVCKEAITDQNSKTVAYSEPRNVIDLSAMIASLPSVTPTTNDYSTDANWQSQSDQAIAKAQQLATGFRLVNLNGDQLMDVCYRSGDQLKCRLNDGQVLQQGFQAAAEWYDLSTYFSGFSDNEKNQKTSFFRYVDRNLDGRADLCLIFSEYEQCAFNQENGFAPLTDRLKIYPDIESDEQTQNIWLSFMHKLFGGSSVPFHFTILRAGFGNLIDIPDINHDGYPEFCYRSIWGIGCSTNDNYGPASKLARITDSYGLKTDIVYGALGENDLYEPAGTIPNGFREQPINREVVASVITDTAVANSNPGTEQRKRIDYQYGGFLVSDDGEQSSFSKMKEIHAERDIVKVTHYYTDELLMGQVERSVTWINGIKVKSLHNDMQVQTAANGTRRLQIEQTEEQQFELNGTLYATNRTEYSDYDAYGYAKTILKTTTMGSDQLIQRTDTDYLHDTNKWLLGRSDYVTVTHTANGATETRSVDFDYEGGKLVKQVTQPGADNRLTIEYQDFTPAGFPQVVTTSGRADIDNNVQTRQVRTTYDALGRIRTQRNALNQTVSYTYDDRCGGVLTVTDIAGRVTTTTYNNYCEKVAIDYPDSNQTTWQMLWATTAEQSALNRAPNWPQSFHNPVVYKIIETQKSDSDKGDIISTAYFDAQGRTVRSITTGFSSNSMTRQVKTATLFNHLGQRVAVTEPFYIENGFQSTPRWTQITYDQVSRPKTESKIGPDKNTLTTHYQYDGATTSLRYNSYLKSTVAGIHGKPIRVTENGLTVTYDYTPTGMLSRTVTAGVVNNSIQYDTRGFKVAQIDAAMGTWSYRSNAFGELIYQKDAKGQETKFYYDSLGRQIRRISPEGTTHWQYLTSGHGIGQLHSESGVDATKSWAYDSLGRKQSETLTVDGQSFITSYRYNDYSQIIEVIHPNDVSLFQRYDQMGALQNVSMKARDFKDIDLDFLSQERESLLLKLEKLKTLQQAALKQAEYHNNLAMQYHAQYRYFLEQFNEVNNTVSSLNDAAEAHEVRALKYLALYQELLKKSNVIETQYGSGHRFKKEREDNEYYYYTRTYCTIHHGWGPTKYCARHEIEEVTIAKSDLVIGDANNTDRVIVAEQTIDPVRFLHRVAQEYNAFAVSETQLMESIAGTEEQAPITDNTVSEIDHSILDNTIAYIRLSSEAAIIESELRIIRLSINQMITNTPQFSSNPILWNQFVTLSTRGNELHERSSQVVDQKAYIESQIRIFQNTAEIEPSERTLYKLFLEYLEIKINMERRKNDLVLRQAPNYPHRFSIYTQELNETDPIEINALNNQASAKLNQMRIAGSNLKSFYKQEQALSAFDTLIVAHSKSLEHEVSAAQLNLQLILGDFDNSDRTHIRYENQLTGQIVPIFYDDYIIFVPEKKPVPVELTIDEAKTYYREQRDYYFNLMEQAVANSAVAIDSLSADGMDGELAAVESKLGIIDEALLTIDGESLDTLSTSQQTLNENNGQLTLWHAAKRTEKGYLQTEVFGNGLYTHRQLAPETGLVEKITTAVVNGDTLRSLTYTYDARGRITHKTDHNDLDNTTTESFLYNDTQGRLSDWTFTQSISDQQQTQSHNLSAQYQHDALGNLVAKTDAGQMTYDPASNRLLSRSHNGQTYHYQYDSNGNMSTADGRSYQWTSFNKASTISRNGQTVDYTYDAGHNRVVKRTANETRYYISPGYERVERHGANGIEVIHRYTVWSDGDSVAVIEKSDAVQDTELDNAADTDEVSYIHRDILGSGELITDSRMQIVARRYYSPYGRLIEDLLQEQNATLTHTERFVSANENEDVGAAVWQAFDQADQADSLFSRYIAGSALQDLSGVRGFTAHETIEEIGLINMNARLYDPVIGRFASADSIIPDLTTPLDYNRYAYVRGNPVVSRDPTGHNPWIVGAVFFYGATLYGDNPTWQAFGQVGLSIALMGADFGLGGGGNAAAFKAGVTNLTISFMQTGRIGKEALEGAAFAALSAGVTDNVANGWINENLHIGDDFARLTAAHMVTQGLIAELRGDKFIHGAVSALGSKLSTLVSGELVGNNTFNNKYGRSSVAAVFGGAFAEATGGDFTQGAVTAAIVHLYNAESGGQNKSTGNRETIRYIKAGIKGAGSAVSVVAGTVAVGACIVLEPCGAIAWLGGSSLLVGGTIGAVDTAVELQNIKNNTDHLPTLERLGNAFGGQDGQNIGANIQITWDAVNVLNSSAGLVNHLDKGADINALQRIEVLGTLNTADDLKNSKQ